MTIHTNFNIHLHLHNAGANGSAVVEGHYAASQKVAGSRPDEVTECYQSTQSFWPH
jgi:hypothetical protein